MMIITDNGKYFVLNEKLGINQGFSFLSGFSCTLANFWRLSYKYINVSQIIMLSKAKKDFGGNT